MHPTVCFFGFDERDEGGRAWAVRTGLAENGVIVKLCRTNVVGFIAKYRDLYKKWNSITDRVDAIYVIFMGYYFMPLAWCLARSRGVPVILDTLVSQYDTEVNDRKRLSRYNPRAWFLWFTDFASCFIADAIVVDTFEHKKFFADKFFVNGEKIIVVPVGCRSDLFIPLVLLEKTSDDFIVEFHGGFTPLQGIEHIIESAKILQDKKENVSFLITGAGQTFDEITGMARELKLSNVEFIGKKPLEELPSCIARGDVCLGIFGTNDKAMRVIPHKVYECMSCGKPVITERSPAALEQLRDRDDVFMVEPGSGVDIAEKILELKNDPTWRARLGERAREVSLKKFSPRSVVKNLVDWLYIHT